MATNQNTFESKQDRNIIDSYKSIISPSKGIYKEKSSKFISFAYPVETEEEIKAIISSLKKEYFDARHHCYAYRLGHEGNIWRANDDGEPSSTAGKPIYGQLLSNELSDVLVVVIRYFGGIKLGATGLIRAYKAATLDVINNSKIVEKIASSLYEIKFDFEKLNEVMKIFKNLAISPLKQSFDNECIILTRVRLRDESKFLQMLDGYIVEKKHD